VPFLLAIPNLTVRRVGIGRDFAGGGYYSPLFLERRSVKKARKVIGVFDFSNRLKLPT
jgi:hypothetical protein